MLIRQSFISLLGRVEKNSSMETLAKACKLMPKVELHAHLNGCIREETLQELQNGSQGQIIPDLANAGPRELSECFELFTRIHNLITNPDLLRTVTKTVIEDFYKDNVVYLELRTTPKAVHDIQSKEIYLSSVIQGIQESQHLPIVVKLIVSVDRRTTVDEAMENVELALNWREKHPDLVVGMELSGDPTKGDFQHFQPAFDKAKKAGLKITLHLPEVFNEAEALLMMSTDPDRVGHAVHIHPGLGGTDVLWNKLKFKRIPVEVCLTSNVVAKCSESFEAHHVRHLIDEEMPFVVCTDDSGVFRTTLSEEFLKLVATRSLNLDQLKLISIGAMKYAFANNEEKKRFEEHAAVWWTQWESSHN